MEGLYDRSYDTIGARSNISFYFRGSCYMLYGLISMVFNRETYNIYS